MTLDLALTPVGVNEMQRPPEARSAWTPGLLDLEVSEDHFTII